MNLLISQPTHNEQLPCGEGSGKEPFAWVRILVLTKTGLPTITGCMHIQALLVQKLMYQVRPRVAHL
jgi:hypothetical protein